MILSPVMGEIPSPNSPESGSELSANILARPGSDDLPSPLLGEIEIKGDVENKSRKSTVTSYSRIDYDRPASTESALSSSHCVIEMERKANPIPRSTTTLQTASRIDLQDARILISKCNRNIKWQRNAKLISLFAALVFIVGGILILTNPSKQPSRFTLLTVEEISGGILAFSLGALCLLKYQNKDLRGPIQQITQEVLTGGNEQTIKEGISIGLKFNAEAALKQGNLSEVFALLKAKYPVDCHNQAGNALLKRAIDHPAYTPAIYLLVNAGGELEPSLLPATAPRINYLFEQAVIKENFQLFFSLRRAGAEAPQIVRNGNTLLHIAIKNLRLKMLKPILEAGVNPNIPDSERNTPLHLVVELIRSNYSFGISSIIRSKVALLIQFGSHKTERNRFGQTPSALLRDIVDRSSPFSGMRENDDLQRIAALLSTTDTVPPDPSDFIER